MATPYAVRAFESWVLRNRAGWRQVVLLSFAAPVLFLTAMGSGVGSLVRDGGDVLLGGVRYRDFVAPGLLAAAAMQGAVGEATWTVMGARKWDRGYVAQLSSPLGVTAVFHGHLLYMALRLAVAAVGYTVVAVLLGHRWTLVGALAVPAAVLAGMAFAAPIAAWAIGRRSEQWFAVLWRVGVMPLFVFSGTFFPLSVLPAGLEAAAWTLPLAHGVALCRSLALNDLALLPTLAHLGYLVALLGVGLVAGRRTFAKALRS